MSDETSGCSGWVRWRVRNQVPSAIAGCQNVHDNLSQLGETELICGQDQHCYNYRCIKCMPMFLVDYYNEQHDKQLVTLPPVECMRPPKHHSLFEVDYGYEGEVVAFYDHYLSRMEQLKGFAINSWRIEQARLVFDSVENTFDASKYTSTKDFEIDWILLNGSVLTIVEIGVRGGLDDRDIGRKGGNDRQRKAWDDDDVYNGAHRLISNKIDQLIRDQVVIEHLLQVGNVHNCCINYLAVWPNLPIDVIRFKIETSYRKALDKLCASSEANSVQFGVISSDAIANGVVYLYAGDGQLHEQPMRFEHIMNYSHHWCSDLKYVTSLLVASVLRADETQNNKTTQPKSNEDQELIASFWENDVKRQKDAKLATGFGPPPKGRGGKDKTVKFPKKLIFGPEQVDAIISSSGSSTVANIFVLTGEAGCGKTTTLLAIMFKHAGKHVSEKKRNKVVFFIPQHKRELRQDIEGFVRQNCVSEWVQLKPLHSLDTTLLNTENVYLIDEFYGSGPELTRKLIFSRATFYIATISTQSKHGMLQSGFSQDVKIMYFRRLYRSSSQISSVCAKLRRLMDKKKNAEAYMDIPWAMSFHNGPPMKQKNSIQISSYSDQDGIAEAVSELNFPDLTKNTLLVCWKTANIVAKMIELQHPHYSMYNIAVENISVDDLDFTGIEYRNVIVVLGEKTELHSENTRLLLYNSMTRATEHVAVICCQEIQPEMQSLLSLSSNTDIIFEKLRSGDNFGSELFSGVTDPVDRMEMMKRIVATKNESQFNILRERGFFGRGSFSEEEKQLVYCMQIMKNSPRKFQALVDFYLLEKKVPIPQSPTLGDLGPIIKLFEPLRFNMLYENYEKQQSGPRIQVKRHPEQEEIMSSLLSRFHPTDIRYNLNDWISRLTKGSIDEVSQVTSLFDSKKVQRIILSFLDLASRNGKIEMLRSGVLLLRRRIIDHELMLRFVDIHESFTQKLDDGSTLIHKYAHGATQDCFKVILDRLPEHLVKFSDESLQDNFGQNPLMTAIGNTGSFFLITERAKKQGDLKKLLAHKDKFGWTCLRWACRVDNLKVVKTLIENADMLMDWSSDLDAQGRTLIHLLSEVGHTHVLRYLLTLDRKQEEPFKVTKIISLQGMSCLHAACMYGRAEVVKMLVEAVPALTSVELLGINCSTLASRSLFEDKERIVELLQQKHLHVQNPSEMQETFMFWMRRKIRSENHGNFVKLNETFEFKPSSFYFLFLFLLQIRNNNEDTSDKPPRANSVAIELQ